MNRRLAVLMTTIVVALLMMSAFSVMARDMASTRHALPYPPQPAGPVSRQVAGSHGASVSQPIRLTQSDYYERGEAIVYDGTNYWLFFGRSTTVTGTYADTNPDVRDYVVYYKVAPSIPELVTASATLISGVAHNANGYQGETGAAYFDGDVWAFATVVSGSVADLFGWYTNDGGTTWTEVGPIITGLGSGQAHHDEIAFDGELWVVEGSGNFTTIHSATPKTGGWTSPLDVDSSLTGGLAHFFVDGSELYLAIYSSSANYIYKYNPATPAWEEVDTITPPEKYDPTLFKVGETYVFAQAPWDGVRQYIIAWSNDTLDDTFFDGGYTLVTEGRYGSNPWVDMWPIGFTTSGGDSYLFFTSERNPDDPSQEISGNIWYLKVDWDLEHDHYTYVQEAVDGANDGETIDMAPGTYVEQVEITKTITLSGTGVGETIIRSPDTLPLSFTTSAENHPIIYVHDVDSTTVRRMTVDGAGKGNDAYRFSGIAFRNAGGTVEDVEIKDVRDTPFSGRQHGVSLYLLNTDGVTRTIHVYDSRFTGFQKNAMALNAASTALTVDVRRNTVIGAGAIETIAQNGIQVWAAQGSGVIADNNISRIAYDNTNDSIKWVASSILDFYAGLTITGNTITEGHMGIYNYDGASQIGGNDLSIEKVGVEAWGIVASDPPDVHPAPLVDEALLASPRLAPTAVDAVLTVNIYSNTLAFSGAVTTNTHGIEVDAGYGPDDLAVTMMHNIVRDFDTGIGFIQCEGSCDVGTYTALVVSRNCLYGNTYGMTSNLTSTVEATGNYWGHFSGPYHPTLNPRGQGDAVDDGIVFDPWSLVCGGAPIERTYLPIVLRNH